MAHQSLQGFARTIAVNIAKLSEHRLEVLKAAEESKRKIIRRLIDAKKRAR